MRARGFCLAQRAAGGGGRLPRPDDHDVQRGLHGGRRAIPPIGRPGQQGLLEGLGGRVRLRVLYMLVCTCFFFVCLRCSVGLFFASACLMSVSSFFLIDIGRSWCLSSVLCMAGSAGFCRFRLFLGRFPSFSVSRAFVVGLLNCFIGVVYFSRCCSVPSVYAFSVGFVGVPGIRFSPVSGDVAGCIVRTDSRWFW